MMKDTTAHTQDAPVTNSTGAIAQRVGQMTRRDNRQGVRRGRGGDDGVQMEAALETRQEKRRRHGAHATHCHDEAVAES